jgi:altronate dehydratase small subunit
MKVKNKLSNCIIILNKKDNVATALKDIDKGASIEVLAENKKDREIIEAKEHINPGFKVSLVYIKKGEKVYKYGDIIGTAKSDIKPGEKVHIENMSSLIK